MRHVVVGMARVVSAEDRLAGQVDAAKAELRDALDFRDRQIESAVMIAAIGDMKSLYGPYVSHAQSFHTRHCAAPNSASCVAHIARPLLGNMISASMPSR